MRIIQISFMIFAKFFISLLYKLQKLLEFFSVFNGLNETRRKEVFQIPQPFGIFDHLHVLRQEHVFWKSSKVAHKTVLIEVAPLVQFSEVIGIGQHLHELYVLGKLDKEGMLVLKIFRLMTTVFSIVFNIHLWYLFFINGWVWLTIFNRQMLKLASNWPWFYLQLLQLFWYFLDLFLLLHLQPDLFLIFFSSIKS